MPPILVERRDRVGLITLNRPEKLNAFTSELLEQLDAALADLDADEQIGAIVLTGAGERAFSAGGDMAEQVAAIDGQPRPRRQGLPWAGLRACKTPVLAAIRGYCFGGGALMAINCDIRLAADDARFKFHGAGYGRALGGAILPRIIGEAMAKELLFTGDEVRADEALRIGLVNHVLAPGELLPTALAMAARIAANSLPAVKAIKETIDLALPVEAAQAHESEVNRSLGRSADSVARFRQAAERVIGAPRAEGTMSP